MVLTACFVLSPATGLFCHRRLRKLSFANLTPASGRQDHTTSPSASAPFVYGASASIASPAALMTLANAPLWLETGRVSATDLPDGASGIFFAEGLDEQVTDLPVGQSVDVQ